MRRILIVDDEAHILQVLNLKLKNAGYEVLTAMDGEDGFETARRELPDLIITDFSMPFLTGIEMCRELVKNESTARIPVIMLTARGYALDEDDLNCGNIRDMLSKPFSPRAVLQLVQNLLESSEHDADDPTDRSRAA